ncbi:hypothetical protein [Muricoccus radiodurans]|uniref:hypothetical protein n=1 Tax=Muricoccus radiodurans TaxID=2231721 RepID=UPI003CF39781
MPALPRRIALLASLAALTATGRPSRADPVPRADALSGQHPAAYYRAAAELFSSGQRSDAVFLFYLGQLRFRTHLAARPNLPPDQDRALFASLSESVGRPANEWAFGDIPALIRTLDAVLVYDARNPDTFTSPTQFPTPSRQTRAGLQGMRDEIGRRADEIRRERASRGLANR